MRFLARAIVALRFLIVPAWIAAAILVSVNLPSVFGSEASELGSLLPRDSEAIAVEEEAIEVFGIPVLSPTMVVAHEPGDFSVEQGAAAARYLRAIDEQPAGRGHLRAVPLLDAPGLLESKRLGSTLIVFLYIDPELVEGEQAEAADRFAAGLQRVTGAAAVHVTGAAPASRAETSLADDDLLWVELATVVLVVAILALYFRSVGIPLLGLATVAIAYQLADHVLGWGSERYSVSIPREVDPVIIALLFGILTDYLVFFVSDYRRHLNEGLSSREAVTEVTTELLPVIATAALMIAGATLTLLLSGVRFLSAFGPGMAVAVLVGAAVALTFVPAMLAIFGRLLLWPGAPRWETRPADPREREPRGHLVGFAAHHPALVTIVCLVALGAAASGLRHLELGNPIIRGLPPSTSPRQGYDVAAKTLGPGVVGPTMLVLREDGIGGRQEQLASLQAALAREDGVAGVVGPPMEPARARPYGVLVAPDRNAARYVLVLGADPEGAEGTRMLAGLEDDLPALLEESELAAARVGITGDTTIAAELNADTWRALERVAPAALLVLLVLLWVLLRSRTAPLYLVGVSVLVVAAALGLTVYFFQDLLGYGELAFFVPVATAILLLALGADYNVFLVSRVWSEAERQDLRPAIRTAGSRAARAITVAGMILALSFAAVALIPIQAFRELAFAMSIGLLLDTLIARTLLIPALVSLFGR
ncbi:MAG TPA: MMPL family transporter [Solirubrobacterales bacterium]|jgi:RND superfamily putative drug exporter|nr:MMPL family transporter [Solirubrobacterales bacterium]